MDNLSYKLETFEGPLDLLLHLINKNKLDIKDIQINILLEQYSKHIHQMQDSGIYIKSEFINMISRLIYIKTVSLLPKNNAEKDLKEELSQEIIKHQELKNISSILSKNLNFDVFVREPEVLDIEYEFNGKIDLRKFINSYLKIYKKAEQKFNKLDKKLNIITSKKIVSVFSRVIHILRILKKCDSCTYVSFFNNKMSRSSIVATFLAMLELIKIKRIKLNKDISLSLQRTKSHK